MIGMDNRPVMSGFWRCPRSVSADEIVAVAKELADGPDGPNYLDLHVRGASDDEFGLGFKYWLPVGKKNHKEHFHKMKRMLTKRFGNKVHWSVATPTFIIKQVGL